MDTNSFVTITGIKHYYDKKPFEIGRVLKLTKEPENDYDAEAIRVELPYIGTVGYVANSPDTVFKGTSSAARILDRIDEDSYARVIFITHSSVIAIILPQETEEDSSTEKAAPESSENSDYQPPANRGSKPKFPIGFKG